MSAPINMVQLVKELPSRPRGRACIVLTHQYQEQKDWAVELAQQTEAGHLNLLERFTSDDNLAGAVSQFTVPKLFEFLKGEGNGKVLIVSGMEFLKASWSGQPSLLGQFAARVETWNQSPCLVFVLQYDKTLATHEFNRYPQYTFIIDQNETLALT